MVAVAFDTLKLARTLRSEAKMSLEQAEGVAQALAEAMSGAELATKADVQASEAKLLAADARADNRELRSELKLLEQRMTIKLGATLAAGVALLSMLKVFGH